MVSKISIPKIISDRMDYSSNRLNELRSRISSINEIQGLSNFCIYATGSYARKEASSHSDLDIFFINSSTNSGIPKLTKTLIDAELIRINRNMGFPDFSGDGVYLEIHSLDNLINELGSQSDDYKNYFTARLLLLLESYSLLGDDVYDKSIEQIVERYYVDFHDHDTDFRPIFLTNDIIRFWKTLTINYEHKRNRSPEDIKNKGHVKNLKLKFSRKLTCFSFVLKILSERNVINTSSIVKIVKQTPLERLRSLATDNIGQASNISGLFELYGWFLNATSLPKEELLKWISDKNNRDSAFDKSREFADLMYVIMKNIDNRGLLKYLLI